MGYKLPDYIKKEDREKIIGLIFDSYADGLEEAGRRLQMIMYAKFSREKAEQDKVQEEKSQTVAVTEKQSCEL